MFYIYRKKVWWFINYRIWWYVYDEDKFFSGPFESPRDALESIPDDVPVQVDKYGQYSNRMEALMQIK